MPRGRDAFGDAFCPDFTYKTVMLYSLFRNVDSFDDSSSESSDDTTDAQDLCLMPDDCRCATTFVHLKERNAI